MKPFFANRLSSLRQEKKISQRKAAAALGVSQALLSHYENGAREPGLAFVSRACDYYSVTSDYLLGRSLSREGAVITAGELPSAADDKDNVARGVILATLHKKLIINTVSLVFDLMSRSRSTAIVKAGARCVSLSLYKLFRTMYCTDERLPQNVFSAEPSVYGLLADSEIKLAEAELQRALDADGGKLPDMNLESLSADYPQLYQSLLSLLHNAGQRGGGQ